MAWVFIWSLRLASWKCCKWVSIQVSPRAYTRENPSVFASLLVCLVRKKQADTRWSGFSAVCRPHQSPTVIFESNLADVANPSITATRQILTLTEGLPRRLTRKPRAAGATGHHPPRPSRLNESLSALMSPALFGYPDWGFPWFSSVVRQTAGYTLQIRGTARTPSAPGAVASPKRLQKVAYPQFGLSTLTANQAKFIPPITSPATSRR